MSDVEQQFQSFVAHLRGDRQIHEDYIAEQMQAMANAGHGGAALISATIRGIGYGCEQDWQRALDWLAVAAEGGERGAREQLQMLSGESGEDWRTLACHVDVSAWSAERPTRVVVERPHIGMAEDFLSARECAWLIARASPLQTRALVYHPVSGAAAQDDHRSNTLATFTILTLDLPLLLIRERIANTIGAPLAHFERTSVFRYLPGQEFTSHVDYLSPSPQLNTEISQWGQRPLTFLVYLNDTFDAGETHFLDIDRKLRGRAGEALYFRNVDENGAPDLQTTHAGLPPEGGEKWLLSQFIRSKPQLPG
ncbi:MAG: 2OG-Fe(II) oxygenase [Hyphomonadaceae bacterium]